MIAVSFASGVGIARRAAVVVHCRAHWCCSVFVALRSLSAAETFAAVVVAWAGAAADTVSGWTAAH